MYVGTYNRLRVHVSASDRTVIRAARRKIARKHRRTREHAEGRKHFYREMLRLHHNWQDMCREFRM